MFHTIDNYQIKTVHEEKELADAITDTITYYKNENARLHERNRELHKNAEAIVRKDYENQIANLEQALSLSYGEFYSEKEKQNYEDFVQEHMHDRNTSLYNGGRAPYLIPHYGGIGRSLKVVCQICGESKDITDTDCW